MKKNLTKQLASYSGLASSILLLVQNNSNAQIVYVDPPDMVLNNGTLTLDLDNNGLVDFEFSVYDLDPSYQGAAIEIRSYNSFIILPGAPCGLTYSYPPKILPHGKEIKKNDLWQSANSYGGQFCFLYYPNCNQKWAGKEYRFIGVRFLSNPAHPRKKNYGWIRLSVSSDCSSITIHDWAYNSIPNQSIQAGQTMRLSGSEENVGNDLQIFSSGNTVYIQNNFGNDHLTVEIFNNLGQLIKYENISEENSILHLDNIAQGVYIVNVQGNALRATQKVFIE